jgi:hypothetical protein
MCAVRAGARQAANEFAACYAKPAQAGYAAATGFSRFGTCQAVNSFMAAIHGQARSRRRARAHARLRAGARQAANEFAACHAKPAQAGYAAATGFSRFGICQAVNSFMAGIHGRARSRRRARAHARLRAGARQAANEFAACHAKPAQAGYASATGFSRFGTCQAVNSFMAGIHGQARSRRRERACAHPRGRATGSSE